jgi:predicted exporter
MSLRDDVLAAFHEGTWYVMIRGVLAPQGVSLTNDDSAVEKIYAACNSITAEKSGLTFVYSGVPFHSYASSSSAQREISLISTITLIIIILLFLYIFRSPLPVFVSVLAAGLSVVSAITSALLFFREVHILTFVFGTTLIGTCVDYSIHFFIHWRANRNVKNGGEIRSLIFRGIALSFVSTAICFISLLFAPFVILKQFAVFSLCGLLNSFLTVTCLYPHIKMPTQKKSPPQLFRPVPSPLKRAALFGIPVIFLFLLFLNRGSLKIENNIGSLYTMPAFLMESEKTAAVVLDHGSAGWYFIVAGSVPEETLEREELLRERLEAEAAEGNLGSYLAASLFIPSMETQKRNYKAAEKLIPLAEDQFAYLGFPPETAAEFSRDFVEARNQYAVPGGDIPPYLAEIISKLWIGRAGESYYSCVLPLHAKNEDRFRQIAKELDGVYFVNKVKDTGVELDSLTRIMLLLFLAAYIIIAVMIKIFYPWKQTLRICIIPFLLILVSLTVLACSNIPVGFFSAMGLILVFGLGLDYMFYITESEKQEDIHSLTVLAIFLSFATTALSFGALALSSFVPVHIFGLTVFSGLTTAFISAMLVSGSDSAENQRITGLNEKGRHTASIKKSARSSPNS